MKSQISLPALLVLAFLNPEQGRSQVYHGQEAGKIIPGSRLVRMRQTTEVPEFIRFQPGLTFNIDLFDLWAEKTLRLEKGLTLDPVKSTNDDLGYTHHFYRQLYNGIPLEWSRYVAHELNGQVVSLHGVIFRSVIAPAGTALTVGQARDLALAHVNAITYKWEIPEEERQLKLETNQLGASYYPAGELVYYPVVPNASAFKLAYKFNIYAQEPLYRAEVYVDAISGDILFENNKIQTADVTGTAVTAYSGTQSFTTDFTGSTYRLRETGRGNGIRTYDLNQGSNYGSAVDFTDGDNFWNNVNANQDEVATDAHWGAEMTYDYYLNDHGRNSIDGNGMALLSYVHYQSNYNNAFWDGARMTYGDGSGSYGPFTALDIAGHEITHGLTEMTANLVYSYESGALNESFSDIFGTSVEWYGKPGFANWLVGEDIGVTLRSMSNPNAYGDPDTYQGTNWATGSADNGGVHTNSGVQNFWYYLLTNGGSGTNDNGDSYSINPLGIFSAGAIAFRNLTVYLWSNSQYADARFYAIQSAIDIFGACSPEVIATTDAWYAVGVGNPFDSIVTAGFTANPTTSCSAPFTASFINTSINGGVFFWDFGDGGTDTVTNPSHTFNNYGAYTVKLIADGNPCGIDSITQTAYITVDSLLPCVVILPASGSGMTQTACSGTLFDNGGGTGNYLDATNSQITIAPTGASSVDLTIVSFDIEPGSGGSPPCDYDYVEFFDGPSTASPSLGRYCNTTGPPGSPLTSTTGSVTIYHHADPYVNGTGFEIQWNCTLPNQPPGPGFTASATSTCSGDVNFTDLSVNGPADWSWDFGDGGTSTQQNPSYLYTSSGTYSVKLVVTNGYGADSLLKTAYIVVNKPVAPSTSGASRCGTGSLSLSANGTGTINWYSDSAGTTLLGTGNTFTTPTLSATTTYYAEDVIVPPSQYVGPVDTTIGTGGMHTYTTYYLIFDCLSPLTIVSVDLYAYSSGYRTIELRNSGGIVLQDTNINIPVGWQNVILDFDVPVGSDFQLATSGMSEMYRNNSGTNFPYTIPGLISITGNNTSPYDPSFYYYYYNWEVKTPTCRSELAPVVANVNPEPAPNISSSANVTCNGNCDGSATVSVSAGTPPYTYLWSNSQTGASMSSLCPGTYMVTVTDAGGCLGNTTAAITEPGALTFTSSVSNANCGNSDGSATVNVSNGVPPYTYLWSDPASQVTATASNLSAGNYTCQITDANGCPTSANVVVNNTVPTVSVTSSTNSTCNGGADGSATALASLGVPPYTYQWNDPASQTTATAANLTAGTYSVTATDAVGCFATDQVTITQPAAMVLAYSNSDASCSGACNGASTITVTNGVAPFTYQWNDPGSQTGAAASGLCDGSFNTTVTDASGCTAISSTSIGAGAGITVNLTGLSNTTCAACNGSATVAVAGGTGPYTYLWSDPGSQSNATAVNLCAGLFNVTATDASGCTDVNTVEIFDGGGMFASISGSTNVTCNGAGDGSVTVSITGGTAPFTYVWNDPATQTTATATGLPAGTYSVTATGSNGCISTATINITQPAPIALTASGTNASCGNSDGTATVNATGGTPAYSYFWSDAFGQTNAVAAGLTAGTYTVTVTDANGCTGTTSVTLYNTGGPSVTTTPVSVMCYGESTGSATATVSGGVPPYTYLWNDGSAQSNQTATGLSAGTYSVTVTDANACSTVSFATLTQPSAITSVTSGSNATCGGSDGTASVTAGGGTPPYTYLWDDPGMQTTAVCTGLQANTYAVTVTDANGCTGTSSAVVGNTGVPSVSTTVTAVSCSGGSNGVAAASVSGGLAPYTYLWDDPAAQTKAIAQGLAAGTYNLLVTDNAGCQTSAAVTIAEPTALVVTSVSTDEGAVPCTGTASVSASGGTPPYTYLWSSGQTTSGISGLCPGNYTATVSDANGCSAMVSESVGDFVGLAEGIELEEIAVYPNPNTGQFNILFHLSHRQDVDIRLYAVTGQVAFEQVIKQHQGSFEQTVDLKDQAAGIYTLRIVFDTGVINRKLIVK